MLLFTAANKKLWCLKSYLHSVRFESSRSSPFASVLVAVISRFKYGLRGMKLSCSSVVFPLLFCCCSMDLGVITFLLRLAWIAGILPILVASVPIKSLNFFHKTLLRFAARGKILQSSDKFAVPQKYFLHFYLVAVVLTTCLTVSTWFYAYREMILVTTEPFQYSTGTINLTGGPHKISGHKYHITSARQRLQVWRTVFVLLLMEAQVLRRLYETQNVFVYSPTAKMHILGYLTGLFFYTAAPLSLGSTCALEALRYLVVQITEFVIKGWTQLPVEFEWREMVKPLMDLGWCQWIGAAIFIWGWWHQLCCHAILGSLRKCRGANDYVIPHGDWFDYVSCPHYLAEIVIYAGILVASGGLDATVWLLFLFVVANLIFAAAETHRWYRLKFDTYPKSRKAIIPFIY